MLGCMKTLFFLHSHNMDPSSVCYRLASKPSTAVVTIFFILTGILACRKRRKEELCNWIIYYFQCWLRIYLARFITFFFHYLQYFLCFLIESSGGYKVGTYTGKYEESFWWFLGHHSSGAAVYSHKSPNLFWLLQWVLQSLPSKKRKYIFKTQQEASM